MSTAFSELGDTTVNSQVIDQIITIASRLADLQSSLSSVGGVVDWFTGWDDLGTFGEDSAEFLSSMSTAFSELGDTTVNSQVVGQMIGVAKRLVGLQEVLPEEGWFDGKMNLTEFSDYIVDFATAMSDFGANVKEIDSAAVATAISTAYRIKNLIESVVDLDTSGVETFTDAGKDIAKAISKFNDKVKEIDTEAVPVAISAAQKLKSLINSLVGLDTSGVESFKPEVIGTKMSEYSNKVSDINAELISSSITSAYRLKNLISGLAGLNTSGVKNFKPDSIATSIKAYANAISGVNVGYVLNSIIAAERLKKFISSLAEINTSGVSSFKNTINQLATISIANVVKEFSGASSKLTASGVTMINGLVKGMSSRLDVVTETITKLLTAMITSISSKTPLFQKAGNSLAGKVVDGAKTQKDAMKSAGKNLGSGLVNGIKAKWDAAYNAGYTLGQKAVQGEKDGQQSKSPSKLTTKAGKWLGEGLIIGMERMGSSVYNAGKDMGGNAVDATRSAMTTILEALNSDVDAQPTIRPVIDLTDVKTGASAISGMLSKTQTLGVRTNLNAINTAINNKLQNGSNDDIISAINKLGEGLDANRGDTYNFGDITYDDGSNVSEAVQTLVRAARIGRRV